jgi:transposase
MPNGNHITSFDHQSSLAVGPHRDAMSRNHRPVSARAGFRSALGADDSNQLYGWIDRARHSKFGPLVRFAFSLQRDLSAVAAAVDASWSSGQV